MKDYTKELFLYAANPGVACGHETLILLTDNAMNLISIPTGTRYAILQVEEVTTSGSSDVIRYLLDGSDPDASTGLIRGDRECFDIAGTENIKKFKAIRLTANSHKINVQYFK